MMKLHGWILLSSLTVIRLVSAQDSLAPRLLGPPDAPPAGLESRIPLPPVGNSSIFEQEIQALRADLQSFHSASEEVARSTRDLESRTDKASLQQRQDVLDLLTKLATQGLARKAVREPELPVAVPKPELPESNHDTGTPLVITDAAVDPFALGKVLFRSGDFQKAEQAFRRVTQDDENRDLIKYMIATCKYRRKQFKEAMEVYQELAASNDDPVIRDLARFQLDGIQWRRDVDQELEQLRKQREKQPGSSSGRPHSSKP